MIICKTPAQMQDRCHALRQSGKSIGLVPTMGALHTGHLSLVAAAQAECDAVAASIFVNPTQFAPGEDYEAYPRDFEEDCRKLAFAGVDLLFAPSAADMYPAGNSTLVDPGDIGSRLDGASRPGHFRGVATIVARLFHIVAPNRAYFGQKDAAQVAVLRRIIRDLNFPILMVVCPTFRDPDGLAMSSRNRYLSTTERARSLILHRALTAAGELAERGETCAEPLRTAMLAVLSTDPQLRLDYAAVVDPDTLLPITDISRGALVAVAAWVGKTRLIDNLLIYPQP
jgi:pantoate--beta-alanine ligase